MFSFKPRCGPRRTPDPVADQFKVNRALLSAVEEDKENSPPVTSLDMQVEERTPVEQWKAEMERTRIDAELQRERYLREEVESPVTSLDIQMEEKTPVELWKAEMERIRIDAELQHERYWQARDPNRREERQRNFEAAEQCSLQRCLKEEQHILEEKQRCRTQEQQRREELERQTREAVALAEFTEIALVQKKVDKFLKDNGFRGVNKKKTSLMSYKFALHSAVAKKDAEMVQALLRCEANPTLRNSSKKTPEQLAVSRNKKGSHEHVLAVLRSHGK